MWIAGAVRTLLTMYGDWPTDPRIEEAWGFAWANDLEGFPQSVIEQALDECRREETRRPVPAVVIKRCRALMPRPRVVQPAEEPREQRCTPDQARAILAEAGFTPRRMETKP